MADTERGATFDEFVQGGLLDDADVTITSARFTTWDYQGKITAPVLGLRIIMEDTEGQQHDQTLSAGELRFFVPSTDGRKAVPVGSQAKLNVNTNAVAFLISIMNADTRGQFAAKLKSTDDIGVLDGLKVHVVRKAQPKRAGIIQQQGEGQREKTQLLVDRVISYPGETGAAAATPVRAAAAPAAQAATPAAAAAPAAGGEVDDLATSTLLTILGENGGSIKKTALAGKVFSSDSMKAQPAPTRNAVLGMIVRDDFLGAEGRPWAFDKASGTVSFGA